MQKTKKTAIYTRVSTDEQAEKGFSLRDQEARLRDYCARTNREVVAHYQDDASAKTFNRPAFQRFLERLRDDPDHVDEFLVVKWDRFSRDMTGALTMIQRLRDGGVAVQAIEQLIDFGVPEQTMLQAVYLAAPQIENERRSMNTTMGIRRALREGRWVNNAPKGYSYDRTGLKPTLVPNDDAPLVREAFELSADTDLAISEILVRLRQRGFKYSRSELYDLLRRVIYTGRIPIKAWRDEPAEVVQGLHEAIVPIELFERVQVARFAAKEKRQPKTRGGVRLEYPLRGHIACPECSTQGEPKRVTASLSGGNGGRYAYYHCHRCRGFRVRADELHAAIPGFLRGISLYEGVADLYREVVREAAGDALKRRESEERRAQRAVEKVEADLLRIDEMFFKGEIEADSYNRLKTTRKAERAAAEEVLQRAEAGATFDLDLGDIVAAVDLLEALPTVWARAVEDEDAQAQHDLIGSITPRGAVFEDGTIRTPWGMAEIAAQSPETQNADPASESASATVPRTGFEPVLPP